MTTALALPLLSAQQLQEFTRLLADDYGVSPRRQRERAGRNLAMLARRVLDGDLADRSVVALVGPGSKGEIGLIAAQSLLTSGAWLQILLSERTAALSESMARRLSALQDAGALVVWAEDGWELPPADLIIDAIYAADDEGELTARARDLIQLANSSMAPIICAGAPSGVGLVAGNLTTPHIHAAATVLHSLPPATLLSDAVRAACGALYWGDLGAPPALFAAFGLDAARVFGKEALLPITFADGRAWVDRMDAT